MAIYYSFFLVRNAAVRNRETIVIKTIFKSSNFLTNSPFEMPGLHPKSGGVFLFVFFRESLGKIAEADCELGRDFFFL